MDDLRIGDFWNNIWRMALAVCSPVPDKDVAIDSECRITAIQGSHRQGKERSRRCKLIREKIVQQIKNEVKWT